MREENTGRKKNNICRIIGLFLLCISMIAGMNSMDACAKTIKSSYLAEQARGTAPTATVYMTGSKMTSSVSVSGKIDGIKMSQDGEVESFAESKEGIKYIYLIDNSGSVNDAQLAEVKEQLKDLRESMGKKDKLSVYTVGAMSSSGEKTQVLSNAKGKKSMKSDCKKIDAIKNLGSNSTTVLYRSINEVLGGIENPDMRTVLVLITDGEDVSEGKDNNNKATLKNVQEGVIPVYGIILASDISGTDRDKIEYTKSSILDEKNCRGYYYDCSTSSSGAEVDQAFQTLSNLFYNETYVINLKANTNETVGKTQLKLTVNKTGIDPVMINYASNVEDNAAPKVDGEIESEDSSTLTFALKDEYGVNLEDAKDVSNYTLRTDTGDEEKEGMNWKIDSVSAQESGNSVSVTLNTEEKLYKGDYVLTIKGIHDNSSEQNAMDQSVSFTMEDGVNGTVAGFKNFLKSYWWILLLIIVILIGVIVIKVIKSKKSKTIIQKIDTENLNDAATKYIQMRITDPYGNEKKIEWTVEGSLFVGRSEICNVCYPDDKLSKQHFVIDVTKMGCYVIDLQSTNGTYVNGVRITDRRQLNDGDIITAGREKFEFSIPKNAYIDPDGE